MNDSRDSRAGTSAQQSESVMSIDRQLVETFTSTVLPILKRLADPEPVLVQWGNYLQTGINHPGERFCLAVTPELQVNFSGSILDKYGQEIVAGGQRSRSGTR